MARGSVKILGCGSSGGVPLVTGYWGACNPDNPKNMRKRASIAVSTDAACVVIDTGADFRTQTLEYGITKIDAIFYTHAHSDHVNGIDELRYLKFVQKDLVKAYGDLDTLSELQARFAHMFSASPDGLYQPVITPIAWNTDQYNTRQFAGNMYVVPFWQHHGTAGRSVGYRFGNFAYSTDISAPCPGTLETLAGIDTWLVDCAQYGTDYTIVHPNLELVRQWNETVGAKRVILTHLTPRLDYDVLTAELPEGYEVAFDGMEISIDTGT